MNLKINPSYTATAQNHFPDVEAVYADQDFIVEKHLLHPGNADMFEFRLVVKRRDGQRVRDWRALQDAKNQVAGPDREAVEVFPPESEVTDTGNMYHLWVFKRGRSSGRRLAPFRAP